ncbi:MAG: addiction module toxin RelE [Caedibacter sp. 37-49]|nr:MAG: addiction module toxin RelE [Caedibacter sp. 37-49]
MKWNLRFQKDAKKEFLKLDPQIQRRILQYFKERILTIDNPRTLGKSLTGNLNEFWRYRVGDYRIICKIEDDNIIITVVMVGHRREVYED